MDDNKETDSKETGEYEDDFEKDLEWLINDKEQSDVACGNEENISQESGEKETEAEPTEQLPDPEGASPRRSDFISVPSSQPLDPISDSDSDTSFQECRLESQKDPEEDEDEEVRRYIMEKIIQANKILRDQEPVSEKRERKLKFKDKLVDLEVPPLEDADSYKNYVENESNVSGKLSQLRISDESGQENVLLSLANGSCEEGKDRKILVERDGKFELLNLQDIESQGFLPPISNVNSTENEPQQSPRSSSSSVSGVKKEEPAAKSNGSPAEEPLAFVPQPPPNPKTRPSSAAHLELSKGNGKASHRTQSANASSVTSTYCLSPRQKELQKRLEQRREKLRREEEQRRAEEERARQRENEAVFRAWLQRKRGQVAETRRVQRAKQIEDLGGRQENRDPQQAFRLWLKKKHEEQLKERKTEELRKQEECLFFLQGTEGRDRAFKQWLRKKRIEKLVEQEAVKERSRQLRLEAKRSRQLQSQLCNMYEAKSFRFTDQHN
ncbi:PREDICTED: coiled-coil domain-containing protein 181 [Miniopterus natalensis]|uniref:coiled-coil domain-containing protein 181 n=1 Tax=Miniopterus natalensis TaxID=291302 RepID=UPI0007A6BBD6|nr:PREDICTED: coiled-coil domain-containing protein 181 [Miniopterus natalensis]